MPVDTAIADTLASIMKRRFLTLILAVTLTGSTCPAVASAQSPGTIIDNFDGPAGSLPDPALWDFDLGPWRDDGLQTYTLNPDNVRLDGDGHLVIQARPAPDGYTSARPVTRGKLTMQYGTISARIKFPPDRESGRRSGCSERIITPMTPQPGPTVARSTSWN